MDNAISKLYPQHGHARQKETAVRDTTTATLLLFLYEKSKPESKNTKIPSANFLLHPHKRCCACVVVRWHFFSSYCTSFGNEVIFVLFRIFFILLNSPRSDSRLASKTQQNVFILACSQVMDYGFYSQNVHIRKKSSLTVFITTNSFFFFLVDSSN